MRLWTWTVALAAAATLAGCATTSGPSKGPARTADAAPTAKPKPLPPGLDPMVHADAFPSTYKPMPSRPTAIVGAQVFTGTGQLIDGGVVLVKDGRIQALGPGLAVPAGYETVDGQGKWVTPGLIDAHSHLGVYASPAVQANSDGNELTNPVTAEVWAEHSVWPQDPGFNTARIGGVTTLLILPGSGNLIGGRGVVLRLTESLRDASAGVALDRLLGVFPAAAEVYENLRYPHAGLCRAPLETSLNTEFAARAALDRAAAPEPRR